MASYFALRLVQKLQPNERVVKALYEFTATNSEEVSLAVDEVSALLCAFTSSWTDAEMLEDDLIWGFPTLAIAHQSILYPPPPQKGNSCL